MTFQYLQINQITIVYCVPTCLSRVHCVECKFKRASLPDALSFFYMQRRDCLCLSLVRFEPGKYCFAREYATTEPMPIDFLSWETLDIKAIEVWLAWLIYLIVHKIQDTEVLISQM